MDLMNALVILVVILAVCIGVFLALREVALWYFRINQIADNIAYIADYYRGQRQAQQPQPQSPPPQMPKFHPQTGQPLP